MRLIDADALIEELNASHFPGAPYVDAGISIAVGKVLDAPTIESHSDIIHCGECKHRDPEDHKCDCGHDILWQLPREDEWYCADAERRTDDLQ